MRNDIKYFGIGLCIGIGATALLLTGMLVPPTLNTYLLNETLTPASTFMPAYSLSQTTLPLLTDHLPTNTYTPTPTMIGPVATATHTDTPTITPTVPSPTPTLSGAIQEMIESGYLSVTGPLSQKQQIQVYEVSQKYIRTTTEDSRLLGEQINGKGIGAPSAICGPLSIAILREAGLVSENIDPHRFWLLNPDILDDRRLLAKAFHPDQFENLRYKIKLNEVDWGKTSLYPGDFVYLYAGTGGNFEHMLVINRVDSQGRAYAVTNHWTPDGFLISEALLYDPSASDAGLFPAWTARPNSETGSTGFAGFELWRSRTP